jgi:Flp pilus assembly protein TadG
MNTSVSSRKRQQGQMLVIFAGALVLILAIAALVVDLGFVFMLRRQEQNAADPGAVAAARYIPAKDTGQMWNAACFYAIQNGFAPKRSDTNALCPGAGTSDGSILTVNYPPSSAAAEYAGDQGYVEVTVRRPHKSFFAGVIGMPTINVATAAVAANDTGTSGSSSLVSLKATGCSTAKLHGGGGGGGVDIFPGAGVDPAAGGYIQVNSDCGAVLGSDDLCTSGPSSALTIAGGTYLRSNKVYVQGACTISGGGAVTIGPPTTFDEQAAYVGDPLALLRPPSPTDLTLRQCPVGPTSSPSDPKKCNLPSTDVTLDPGTYYGGWQIGNGTKLHLNPGIYVLAGGGISQTGGITEAVASGRVLIYGTDSPACATGGSPAVACQQEFDFTANTTLNLRGLDKNSPCLPYGSVGCPYGGLLFWQDANASGAGTANADVNIAGSGSLYVEGTIYTANGNVKITGNSLSTGCTPDALGNTNCAAVQIIASTFDVGGGGILSMPYDPKQFYDLKLKGLVR